MIIKKLEIKTGS